MENQETQLITQKINTKQTYEPPKATQVVLDLGDCAQEPDPKPPSMQSFTNNCCG